MSILNMYNIDIWCSFSDLTEPSTAGSVMNSLTGDVESEPPGSGCGGAELWKRYASSSKWPRSIYVSGAAACSAA